MEDRKGKYGLILPSKVKKVLGVPAPATIQKSQKKATSNVFGDDSDPDDDPSNVDWVKKSLMKQSTQGSIQQRQATQVIKKALKEDPTVYQYDELYDDMEQKRENAKDQSAKDRKPKYIEKLLKATEMRQKEYDSKLERDVQKEREAEGDKFKDKEAFVTGAYRKKMEDMEREKEEQARKDAIDDMTDVTKQKDLSGFYRHLYKQTLGPEPDKDTSVMTDVTKQKDLSGVYRHLYKQSLGPEPDKKTLTMTDVTKQKDLSGVYRDRHLYKQTLGPEPDKKTLAMTDITKQKDLSGVYRDRHLYKQTLGPEPDQKTLATTDVTKQKDLSGFYRHLHKQTRGPEPGIETSAKRRKEEPQPTVDVKITTNSDRDLSPVLESVETKTSIWDKRTVGQVLENAILKFFERKQSNTLQAAIVQAK